jgi:hypothetical protein
MANALTLGDMSPELLKVVDRAKREPEGRFHSLAHLIDVPALERAYHRQRSNAAVGVDVVVYVLLETDPEGPLADGVQDPASEPQTGEDVHLRGVPSPSAFLD